MPGGNLQPRKRGSASACRWLTREPSAGIQGAQSSAHDERMRSESEWRSMTARRLGPGLRLGAMGAKGRARVSRSKERRLERLRRRCRAAVWPSVVTAGQLCRMRLSVNDGPCGPPRCWAKLDSPCREACLSRPFRERRSQLHRLHRHGESPPTLATSGQGIQSPALSSRAIRDMKP